MINVIRIVSIFGLCLWLVPDTALSERSQTQDAAPVLAAPFEHGLRPPSDASKFIRYVDTAFVGTFIGIDAPRFLDPTDPATLSTRLTFRLVRVIKSRQVSLTATPIIEVWSRGGTYRASPDHYEPVGPSSVAASMQVGGTYFVAALRSGEAIAPNYLFIAGRDVGLVYLDGDKAIAMSADQKWVAAIVEQGRGLSRSPGVLLPDREAFLAALDRAGNAK